MHNQIKFESLGEGISRLKVHGGWLIQTAYMANVEHSFFGLFKYTKNYFNRTVHFVKDENHEWIVP